MHSIISNNKRKQRYSAYLSGNVVEAGEPEIFPVHEQANICECGKNVEECKDSYLHMSKGY